MDCLYGKNACLNQRYRDRPFCKRHYYRLMKEIETDLLAMMSRSDSSAIDIIDHAFNQEGGNFLGAAAKIGKLVSAHSGKISEIAEKGRSLEAAMDRAQILTQNASQVTNQVEGITGQIGSLSGSFDQNFGQNQLTVNSPLGSQGNFQSFGDYVCIKKTFLADLRMLLFELLAKRDTI